MVVTRVVVCLVALLAGCAAEIRSNLIIGRQAPGGYQEQIRTERPGTCVEQQPGPGEQILQCSEEKHSHLTEQGKTWITVGAVGGGVLITALVVLYVVIIVSAARAIASGP